MENRNSYFKPMVEQDSLYLEIFPEIGRASCRERV